MAGNWIGSSGVADRGVSSQDSQWLLGQDGGQYIVGERMHSGVPEVEEALGRPGRYRRLKDNLEVKGVVVGARGQNRGM